MHVTADGWEDVSVVIPEVRPREGVTEEPRLETVKQPPNPMVKHEPELHRRCGARE